jgi:hypothetical protein
VVVALLVRLFVVNNTTDVCDVADVTLVLLNFFPCMITCYKQRRVESSRLVHKRFEDLPKFAAVRLTPFSMDWWFRSEHTKVENETLSFSTRVDQLFGVFQAEVITSDLYIGLLPVKTKTGLIFPKGKFSGIWTSIELQFATKYGYKIKVTKGYQFSK